MTTLNKILLYEDGALDEEETVELFQELVNSGLAWKLQGKYGRTASALITAGRVSYPMKGGTDGDA
jgi:hypothetical protein